MMPVMTIHQSQTAAIRYVRCSAALPPNPLISLVRCFMRSFLRRFAALIVSYCNHWCGALRRLVRWTSPIPPTSGTFPLRAERSRLLDRAWRLGSARAAEHIEEWRKLTAEKARGEKFSPSQPMESGVKKTARELGVAPAAVRNAAKIAALPQETRDQARTSAQSHAQGPGGSKVWAAASH